VHVLGAWTRGPLRAVLTAKRTITTTTTTTTTGYAPAVLRTALYFVERSRDFDSALDASLKFAGSPNFCPVIVGALAGACACVRVRVRVRC
jgi:ADP-ribosylglycohydrolase